MSEDCPSLPACCQTEYGYQIPGTPFPLPPTGAPVVQSASISVAPSGAVNYQIIATNSPASYGATNLPIGLVLNTTTGVINGNVPATLTTYSVPISATNGNGTGNATLTITVKAIITLTITPSASHPFIGNNTQVSIDRGGYQALSSGTPYVAFTQIKIKVSGSGIVNTPLGTISEIDYTLVTQSGAPVTILAGSTNVGSMTFPPEGVTCSVLSQFSGALFTLDGNSVGMTGPLNFSKTLATNTTISAATTINGVISASSVANASSTVFVETILNF